MKKSMIFVSAAAMCLLAACSKNAEPNVPVKEAVDATPTLICAVTEADPAPKSSVSSTGAFAWSTGDQVALYAGSWQISSALDAAYNGTNSATFEFPAGINASRADFAVFPASLVFDGTTVRSGSAASHTASSLVITLPGSYNLAQVQGDAVPPMMIASNAPDGALEFKHLGAVLRLTLNNVPKQTRSITFDFDGKKVQGEFTLESVIPGNTAVNATETTDADDIITVLTPDITEFTSGLVVNIPVPLSEFGNLTVATWDADGHKINGLTLPVKKSDTWMPARKALGKRDVTLPVFSVSADKKVVFAPGHLQAVISSAAVDNGEAAIASTWKFAPNQYDCIGRGTTATDGGNAHKTLAAGATVDLFCFVGESAIHDSYGLVMMQTHNADYLGNTAGENMKSDYGSLVISDGAGGTYPAGTWQTEVKSEWEYVINSRVTADLNGKAKARYARIRIDGVNEFYNATAATSWKAAPFTYRNGIVVFPDAYEHPEGVALPVAASINNGSTDVNYDTEGAVTVYSLSDWARMEAAGCIFLTSAGLRQYSGSSWAIGQVNYYAYYLSTTGNAANTSYCFAGQNTKTYAAAGGSTRNIGKAVRLMRQVN